MPVQRNQAIKHEIEIPYLIILIQTYSFKQNLQHIATFHQKGNVRI